MRGDKYKSRPFKDIGFKPLYTLLPFGYDRTGFDKKGTGKGFNDNNCTRTEDKNRVSKLFKMSFRNTLFLPESDDLIMDSAGHQNL